MRQNHDWCERRLVVNPAEAATVRLIFERYLKLRSVRLLKEELEASVRRVENDVRRANDASYQTEMTVNLRI